MTNHSVYTWKTLLQASKRSSKIPIYMHTVYLTMNTNMHAQLCHYDTQNVLSNTQDSSHSTQSLTFISIWNCWVLLLWHFSLKISFFTSFIFIHYSWYFAVQCDCVKPSTTENASARTYFMHILLQLISSKAAVFFISDENSGWLPISLLLIISFSFDLDYDCSVRYTHLFISFAWWDGLFGDCTDWCTLKMASEANWSLVRVHTWRLHFLCVSVHLLTSSASCCVKPRLSEYHVYFFPSVFGCFCFRKKHHTLSVSLTTPKMLIINTVYYHALLTANIFSDTPLMTWNLYHKHQTSLPMCREGTEYLSRAHTDEHRGTSVCVGR